jgi:hypothetical protein
MFPRKLTSIPAQYGAGFLGKGVTIVRIRIVGSVVLSLVAMAGAAQASSLVVLGPPASTPSIMKLVALEPSTAAGVASSIVALGEPMPGVTDEKVAALPDQPAARPGPRQSPMIIRGGVVGGAFETPTPPAASAGTAAAPAPAATAPTPASGTAAARPANGMSSNKKVATSASTPASAPRRTPIPGVGKLK